MTSITRLLLPLLIFAIGLHADEVILSPDERAWLLENPLLKVANEKDWPPFDFMDEGEPAGYSIDLIELAAEKIGMDIEFVNNLSWTALLARFQSGEIDIMPAIYKDAERETYMRFTDGYFSQPTVMVVRADDEETERVGDLAGRRVAVIEGFVITTALEEHYPSMELVPMSGIVEAMQAVSLGKADALLESIGLVSWVLENNYIPNIRIIHDVKPKGISAPMLYMAVGKNEELLLSILQKGLDAVTEEEMIALRRTWLSLGIPAQVSERNIAMDTLRLLGIGSAVFLVLLMTSRLVFRIVRRREVVLPFGTMQFRVGTFIALSLFIAVVGILGWWSMDLTHKNTVEDLEVSLNKILKSTVERLDLWVYQQKTFLEQIAGDPNLVTALEEVIEVGVESDKGKEQAYRSLHQQLGSTWGEAGIIGFFIIDQSGKLLYSDLQEDFGATLELSMDQQELLDQAFAGASVFLPQAHPDSLSLTEGIAFLTPIVDESGNVLAVLGQSIDHQAEFSNLFLLSRSHESDETYAFDQLGRMISRSRFEDQLIELGLLEAGQTAVRNISLRDPGGDMTQGYEPQNLDRQPYTRMAYWALKGNSGSDLTGYRDYRGVTVLGVWLWLERLQMGVASEIDSEEAFDTYDTTRSTVIGVLALTLLISLGSTLFVLALGEGSNKALVKARDELELRVAERTTELSEKTMELEDAYSIIKKQKDRMEGELNVGREIQMNMLPLTFPAFPDRTEFDVYAKLEPAREVGGDFYDFYFLDEDHFLFTVGDVSGKGVPSALFMAITKTLIKSHAMHTRSTSRILNEVNAEISRDNSSNMFVTQFLCILHLPTGTLKYTNAGHNPPYLKKARDQFLLRLDKRHGPVIGAVQGIQYKEDEIRLRSGDSVLLYTDGVTEAMNLASELFGEGRLKTTLMSERFDSIENMVRAVVNRTEDFSLEAEQADDITVLGLGFLGDIDRQPRMARSMRMVNRIEDITRIIDQFDRFARDHSFAESMIRKLKLILDDMLNNIVNYAFNDESTHEIDVNFKIHDTDISIQFIDDGHPFDPFTDSQTPDLDGSAEERDVGGLGIHLIKSTVDRYEYRRRSKKNIVTLFKKIEQEGDDHEKE